MSLLGIQKGPHHVHQWKIVLGLVFFPETKLPGRGDDGYFEYQVKCTECGERCRLNDEIMQQVFKNGGIDEDESE